MFSGVSIEQILLIAVVAAVVLGPERLPQLATQLARLTKKAKAYAQGARTRVQEEMGEEVDWQKLDPRQYDPRRIIRDALLEDDQPAPATATAIRPPRTSPLVPQAFSVEDPPPFDSEAT